MVIAYLVNQYPKVSHSFIRREIAALEQCGATVYRYSIRRAAEELRDPADKAELERTRALLEEPAAGWVLSLSSSFLRHPARFLGALWLAVRTGWDSDRGLARHLAYVGEAAILANELRRRGVEHVHAHFATNSAAVAMLCRQLGGPPYSFTVHGPDDFARAAGLSLAEKVERSALAVAVSEYGLAQLLQWCRKKHHGKIHVVPMGVDEEFLGQEPVPISDDARLVFVGRLEKQKNPMSLVEAVSLLRDAGIECEVQVIGDGSLRGAMEGRIRELGLGSRITLRGSAAGDVVRNAILDSRALVLPSDAETLPVAIMESLALGRPVIASDVGGVAELVEPGCCGWLIEPRDVRGLAEAMRQALQASPSELEQMGREGRRRVAGRHDSRRAARHLLDLFGGARS